MTAPLNVLLVTYAFPPRGGVAVQRVLSWARHLPAHGIRLTVLTATPPLGTVQADTSLLTEVPDDVRVIRTPSLEPYRLYRALGGKRAQDDPRQRATQVAGSRQQGGVGERIYRWVQERWLVPDPKIGWFPFALEAARGLQEEGYRPDVVLATQPPATALVIGDALAQRWKAPLVVDYRDPWNSGYYPLDRPPAVADREIALERRVLQRAAAVVTVSASFAEKLSRLVQDDSGLMEKLALIENGYDPIFGENIESIGENRPVLLHAGSLYAQRSPEPFFAALRALTTEDPALTADWTLRLQGNVAPDYLRDAEATGVRVQFDGFVSHRDALLAQRQAEILLLFTEGMLTAKVYEYLAARRPILAIGPAPDLDALLQSWGVGRCYDPADNEGIRDALKTLMQHRNATGQTAPLSLHKDLATIQRSALAGDLARLLYRVAGRPAPVHTYTPSSHA